MHFEGNCNRFENEYEQKMVVYLRNKEGRTVEEINGWKNTFTRIKELSGFIVGRDLVLSTFY